MGNRGLYNKYHVSRVDGKIGYFDYFVLDLINDPFSQAAIIAYARACKETHPALAADLFEKVINGNKL